jgi:DNA polymerase
MYAARLAHPADFEGWRTRARRFAQALVAPTAIDWRVGEQEGGLFGEEPLQAEEARALSVPRAFIELAQQAICHSDPLRFDLLYRLLWRLQEERELLRIATDADVYRAEALARSVRRDMHKMTAFVRFREVQDGEGGEAFVAWFEPEHHILERVAPFFVQRFASMRWTILTPRGTLVWDGQSLRIGEGASRSQAPTSDAMEDWWRTYYASIFNPARLKPKAMKAEMPVKYWRNLPEAELISPLMAQAARRTQEMIMSAPTTPQKRRTAVPAQPVPDMAAISTWAEAAAAARGCQRCDLWRNATQTVFGEGPQSAPVMFVGEQPGDQEDLAGKPFVGPAGKMFDHAMAEAGLDRSRAYVTNAVKHFKFTLRGKRRIHEKPNVGEIKACHFWLELELGFVEPQLVVALGATALRALTGHAGSLSAARGQRLKLESGVPLLATVHPSFLLRLPDEEAKEREIARFIGDLKHVGELVPELLLSQAA